MNIASKELIKDKSTMIKEKLSQSKGNAVEDSAITKEEFFRKIDDSMQEYEQGRYVRVSTKEELQDFLNSLTV